MLEIQVFLTSFVLFSPRNGIPGEGGREEKLWALFTCNDVAYTPRSDSFFKDHYRVCGTSATAHRKEAC